MEGFLCPICMADLKTPDALLSHFDGQHSDGNDQDLIASFRSMLLSAGKKIRNEFAGTTSEPSATSTTNNSTNNTNSKSPRASPTASSSTSSAPDAAAVAAYLSRPQTMGADMSHTAYFVSVRTPRVEYYASQTNKLIILLHKLLANRPVDRAERRAQEQLLVQWADGKLVKLCPGCAKRFQLTRRQHHCRLCGSIMCDECSRFLAMDLAFGLVSPLVGGQRMMMLEEAKAAATAAKVAATARASKAAKIAATVADDDAAANAKPEDNTMRVCEHCLRLLETRQDMQDARTLRPPICDKYDRIRPLKEALGPDCVAYGNVVEKLLAGETIFTLADAVALRARITDTADRLSTASREIAELEVAEGSMAQRLQRTVRQGCMQCIEQHMLQLVALPTKALVEERQRKRKIEEQQRVERERRLAQEEYERRMAVKAAAAAAEAESNVSFCVTILHVRVFNAFFNICSTQLPSDDSAADQLASGGGRHDADSQMDVLMEQITIIKGYIRKARAALRFEEVEALELNLRELQNEVYERQKELNW